jgi:phosphatidylinositol glycan class F
MTMANKTNKRPKDPKPGDTSHSVKEHSRVDLLPAISYIPTVGVHTTLLVFNALFLPRTTFLQDITRIEIDPAQLSSLDHPQHPFLDPLTKSPLSTLVYICFGTAVLQSWWAGYVRNWWARTVVYGSDSQRRLDKAMIGRQKVKVRPTRIFESQSKHSNVMAIGVRKGMAHDLGCFPSIPHTTRFIRFPFVMVR